MVLKKINLKHYFLYTLLLKGYFIIFNYYLAKIHIATIVCGTVQEDRRRKKV